MTVLKTTFPLIHHLDGLFTQEFCEVALGGSYAYTRCPYLWVYRRR